MTSLMTLLTGTLPIAAADCELRGGKPLRAARGGIFQERRLDELIKVMTYLPPPTSPAPKGSDKAAFGGWDARTVGIPGYREWSIDSSSLDDPSSVKNVRYRRSGKSSVDKAVFNKVSFGHLEQNTFDTSVVVRLCDQSVALPLTDEFLWAQWMVHGARLAEADHPMWLGTAIDLSLLRVFVFDLVGNPLVPHPVETSSDPALEKVQELYRELYDHNAGREDDLNLNLDLGFFPYEAQKAACDVNASTQVNVRPTRVVVACSLTLCQRSKDFEPSGTSEVARVYPHIAVVSNVDLDSILAAVQVERPATSSGGLDSDGAHRAPARPIDGMLMAFTNEGALTYKHPLHPATPFWDNVLNYYQVGLAPMVGRTLCIVDSARTGTRSDNSGWVTRCGEHPGNYQLDVEVITYNKKENRDKNRLVLKVSRQAAFDSLQMGPSTSPFLPTKLTWNQGPIPVDASTAQIDDKSKWFLDSIQFSPSGGTDSLQWSWRWSDISTAPPTWGFSLQQPYKVPGEPMVPHNQTVFVRFTSKTAFVYLAKAIGARALEWTYFCHHGAAYLVDDSHLAAYVASTGLEYADGYLTLSWTGGSIGDVSGDWSFASWRFRYLVAPAWFLSGDVRDKRDGTPHIVERVEHVDLEKAMKL